MRIPNDSTPDEDVNAALFCDFADTEFMRAAIAPYVSGQGPCLITDSDTVLSATAAERRLSYRDFGLDALPIDRETVLAAMRKQLALLDGVSCIIVDMSWGSATVLAASSYETWGGIAEALIAETSIPIVSLYNQELLVEDQLLAAFRAHPRFLAPSGLYENPYWMPEEIVRESTLDEQLGFMLGRVVPDYSGTQFFKRFDRLAARGASPDWLARPRNSVAMQGGGARWHIYCLGPLRVYLDGNRQVDWRTPGGAPKKTKTLFAYLLNAGEKGVHAEQIGELLWQDDGEEKTKRARLHHTVAMLRKALGSNDAVLRAGDYYRLNAPKGSWFDINGFEQICRRALSLARHGQEEASLRLYFEAEQLYSGDLFEDIPQEFLSTDTEDWVLPKRTWLREMALRVQYDMSKLLRRFGRYGEALDRALKGVALDPINEGANIEAMRVFHAQGRTDAMHRHYRQYRTSLAAMGETVEGAEIRGVYDELCRSLDRLSPRQRKTKELVLR